MLYNFRDGVYAYFPETDAFIYRHIRMCLYKYSHYRFYQFVNTTVGGRKRGDCLVKEQTLLGLLR